MSTTLRGALDGAQYVEFHPEYDGVFAVWHGGHTVNFYETSGRGNDVNNHGVINVGDFAKDNATLEEVKDSIESAWENDY